MSKLAKHVATSYSSMIDHRQYARPYDNALTVETVGNKKVTNYIYTQ